MKNSYAKYLLGLVLLLVSICQLHSQVYLQLERPNNPNSLKFYSGETFEYILKSYPDTWRKNTIIDLKPEEQVIVFDDQFHDISEITTIRLRYPKVKGLGTRFMQFGALWFAYGGIASVASEGYSISGREVLIGAGFAFTGFILRTLFSKRKIRLSNRKRLRIMDLRFDPIRGY